MTVADLRSIDLVRGAAVMQGLALVVVPALSTVITGTGGLALTTTQYGSLFIPQTVFAIAFSLVGSRCISRLGVRFVLTFGFATNVVAMTLIAVTSLLAHDRPASYGVLLIGTAFLGTGFAIVAPTLNVLASKLEPNAADRALLVVNALLGGSAVVAPLLSILFIRLGWWWTLPLLCAMGMFVLCAYTVRSSIEIETSQTTASPIYFPARLWQFVAFAFVYGLCEQLNASWAPLYMSQHLAADASLGLLALAFFWGAATVARVFFAVLSAQLKPTMVFRTLPFIVAFAFLILATLPRHGPGWLGIAAFTCAGIGVSALLPLALSFAERSMAAIATAVTSIVFASYLAGYGAAAFGVGALLHVAGVASLDAWAVGLACIAGALSFIIVHTMKETA